MKLVLPIYKGREPVKFYKADTLTVSFGTIEDIIDALKLDGIQDEKSLGIAVIRAVKQLKPFLRDIFDGLTDEEIRNTHMDDIVKLFSEIFRYASEEISGVTGKN